jgi:hypothetical protein
MRQPDKTIVFETKAEFDAFMRGFLWERDEYEADIVTTNWAVGTPRVRPFPDWRTC